MQDQMLNVKELATFLNVVERTIYRLIESKEIPYYRLGSNSEYRFNKEEVLSALSNKTVND